MDIANQPMSEWVETPPILFLCSESIASDVHAKDPNSSEDDFSISVTQFSDQKKSLTKTIPGTYNEQKNL